MRRGILIATALVAARAQIVENPIPGDPLRIDSGRVAGKLLPSGGMALYDGENVARRGAIFVGMNYRVSPLGFMTHREQVPVDVRAAHAKFSGEDPPARILAGHQQNEVPILIGFTHDESSNAMSTAKDLAGYKAAAVKPYGNDSPAFLKLYPPSDDAEAREMGRTAAREGMLGRAMRNRAVVQSRSGAAPVYLYMFSRVHPYIPDVAFADQDPATIGAYHSGDLADWPQWKSGNEAVVEFGDPVQVQRMNTARMEFMAAHAPGPATPRAARD
jgi:carboxylesterase type B